MPELPEVASIHADLSRVIIGQKLKSVAVKNPSSFKGGATEDVAGSFICELSRHGKTLHIGLGKTKTSPPTLFISIHLKMSGQLTYSPSLHTRVIFELDTCTIYFNDARKFGWVKVTKLPLKPKGPDALSPHAFSHFNKHIQKIKKPIKLALMDQELIAGIGNIYANDILWLARINPSRPSSSLDMRERGNLKIALTEILDEAIRRKGSSKTWVYRLPDGSKGTYQDNFKVYDREGKPCLRCKTQIQKIKLAGRSTFYCPKCQQ